MSAPTYTDRALYRRLLRQAAGYGLHLVGILLLGLLATPLALLTPIPLKIAVDNALGGEPLVGVLARFQPPGLEGAEGALVVATALLVLLALLTQLQNLGHALLTAITGEQIVLDFRTQLFRHTQRLSHTYHDRKGSADAIYRILYDAPTVQRVAIDGVIPFITSIVTLLAMVYVTVRIDAELALVALLVSPVIIGIVQAYRGRLKRRWRAVKRHESSAFAVVQEVLGALRVVKAFGQEDREQGRFVDQSREGISARVRVVTTEGTYSLLVGLVTALGTGAVLFIGVRHVQSGSLTLGDLLVVMSYLGQLYGPLKTIGRKVTSLQGALVSAERTYSLLDEAPDVDERPDARPLARARGAVAFHRVTFAYEPGRPVLQEITFEVPAGARVGILGVTGAGKSTLVNLLPRFHDPVAGAITLDGVDLRDYRLTDLRDQFAIVLQEPVLFSTSIRENIAYARPEASQAEIEAAAEAADAHAFIAALPEGYATSVGERGLRLSGGERQRISLARAFLRDAPLLILDEPTSAVDMQTEAEIMGAMERLMRGRTTFMIAHRLSTLSGCDLLLRIEDGALVEVIDEATAYVRDALTERGLTSVDAP